MINQSLLDKVYLWSPVHARIFMVALGAIIYDDGVLTGERALTQIR